MPVTPRKSERNRTQSRKLTGDLSEKRFWDKEFDEAENSSVYQNWCDSGESADRLASRRLMGNDKDRTDLVDIVGSVQDSLVSELVYQDPIPTCNTTVGALEDLEPIWEKLLARAVVKSKVKHQVNAKRFLAWGLVGLKRPPSAVAPVNVPIRPRDILFNKDYMENGTCPMEDSRWLREKITMPLSTLRARARAQRWNKAAVDEIATKINPSGEPDIFKMVDVYEAHFRDKSGDPKVIHYAKECSELLETPKPPELAPILYSFLRRTGSGGIDEGILARIVQLDRKFNKILRRAATRAENRADYVVYDKSALTSGATNPGRGQRKGGAERALKAGKKGVVLLGVDLTNKSAKDVIAAVGVGQIDPEEMRELEFLWIQVHRTIGSMQQELGSVKGGRATATEVVTIKEQQERIGGLSTGLLDEYLETDIQNAAIWMRHLWLRGMAEGQETLQDWFYDILDEKELLLLEQYMPTFSPDLREFVFGIEPGSTHQMFNQLKMQKLVELYQFTMQSPNAIEWLARIGKEFRIDKLMEQLYRLAGAGDVDDWFKDVPREMPTEGTEGDGGGMNQMMAALQGAQTESGGGAQWQPAMQG